MIPKLVIFDCDGVLVDSEPVTDRAMALNLARYGLTLSESEVHKLFVGGTIKGAGEEATRMGANLPENWVDEMYGETFAALRQGVDVLPGVYGLLDKITAQGIKIAIASNGPVAKMEITLPPVDLWDRFAGRIYSGHDHGAKPAPDMILKIMADAGVRPADTVMIDDSMPGCLSAINAGARCLGFVADGDPTRFDNTPIEPVAHMDDIAGLIGLG